MTNIQVTEQFRPHNARVVTPDSLRESNLRRRIQRATAEIERGAPATLDETMSREWYADRERRIRELEDGKIPYMAFPEGFDFRNYGRVINAPDSQYVFELTTQGQFGTAFSKRLEYEVDAGRDEVPVIYTPIYDQMINAQFEETFEISTMGDVGVVMTQIVEGGEVRFATVGKGSHTIKILRYASGIQYTWKLFQYNKTWMLAPIEREFGKAINALHNHIHLSPILTETYAASNKTSASSTGTSDYEKVANTIDKAISAATKDKVNPRRGPYVLVCSLTDLTRIERALGRVPQEGFNLRPSSMDQIRTIIAYDGWSGSDGEETVTYDGVTAGKAYLVHTGHRNFDFQSKVKFPLNRQEQEGDLARFIARKIVFSTDFGVYAAPSRAVQEITLPS
jgi:hypothetical protein